MPELEKTLETKRQTSVKRGVNWKKHLVHLFLLPALIFYVWFQVFPIFSAFWNSFYSWNGMQRGSFAGLENFVRLFTESPFKEMFYRGFGHNVIFFILTVVSKLIVAFFLAMLINSKIRGKEFFKAVIFMPKLLSVIVVGFLFSLILNPTYGALNTFLSFIGLEALAKPWLGSPDTALYTIILVNSWYGLGFAVLIFLAGLQAIPSEIYDAAKMDGASGLTMLLRITLPMAMPSVMVMTILTFIGAFEAFELIFAMQGSQAGPYYSTDVLATYFYRLAFGSVEGGESIGLGSALAVVLFLMISSATAVLLFFFKRKEFEQ
ncbi:MULTISPECIES: carbohydrate ABC transporter permease [Brevibacillus]|uniref:Sugar ABC transporter permease n=1 Tax=Brevibacillus borstelensis AK1 TaxID=1300222 RepID=M8DWC6_9BACL|nr:sugar ABC transporter permease [Brevibacillus borstelensis]EMT51311.1 sugar ABC transporter permease [Brevibacillus borstelensis AK1]WNF05207.1 sugar ABC transporter permease [Brevibacillus borstelensis]GED55765.1 sugar ABC transporter permease [Brevibacillus borstelensis]